MRYPFAYSVCIFQHVLKFLKPRSSLDKFRIIEFLFDQNMDHCQSKGDEFSTGSIGIPHIESSAVSEFPGSMSNHFNFLFPRCLNH